MKHKYLFLMALTLFCLGISCRPAIAFQDSNSHWARPQIEHLNSRGMISGYPDGSFRPDSPISREEFVTLLVKIIHKDAEAEQLLKGNNQFADVQGRWSSGSIELAWELNFAQGNEQGLFLPAKTISREEAVTMLVNCLKANTQGLNTEAIADHEKISPWANEAVAYAWQQGLIHGYPDGTFNPQANLSRAETASLLEQILIYQGDQYQFYGTIKSINLSLKQVTIELNGAEQSFELASMFRVYQQGGKEPVKELQLPAQAYFDLDNNGKLVFAQLSDESVYGQVKINLMTLPTYARLVSPEPIVTADITDPSELTPTENLTKNPGSSLAYTRDAMKVRDFVQQTGASGRGQLVAVIDSGVDPGHPDLQYTQDKYHKIIDFIDLTNEGRIELDQVAQASNGTIVINGVKIDVTGLKSVDGLFRYGYLNTQQIPMDTQGLFPSGKILAVACKSQYIDKYDSLYMDLNGDGQLNNELQLKKFSELYQTGSIKGSGAKVFNFVLAEMARDGQYVKLGFDGEGHGTMVSGIVAANGKIKGVAADAQILPIKVLDSAGLASLDNLKLAMRTAAERGAKIAVVSMGQSVLDESSKQALSALAEDLWQKYGMAICVAAGNAGPGLNTVMDSSAIKDLISVGAYTTPEMLQNDYGWKIKDSELWYFSAAGPGQDGQTAPLVVAPGSAVSCYPMWADSIYKLDQGSSMAAPHVAGAAALLMDAVSHRLFRSDPRAVWMALLGGAEPLDGYQPAEQGYGAINLLRSWDEVKNMQEDPLYYQVQEYSPGFGYGSGFYSRLLQPGELSVTIKNPGVENTQLALGSLASWVSPGQLTVQLPANSSRSIDLNFSELSEPGLYSGFILADNSATPGWDVAILQTVVVPYRLSTLPGKRLEEQNVLDAGKYKRYFLLVPQGSSKLELSLLVGNDGRARMQIIAPDGSQETTDYAGIGALAIEKSINKVYNNPLSGTWEVVVYSSVTLSELNLDSSKYNFTASLETAEPEILASSNKYLVSALPSPFKIGAKTHLSLHFYNPNSKQPVNTVVSINDRLYEVKEGLLQMEIVPDSEILNLTISC
jgi:tripeptidyl-peptidase-2